MTTPTRPRPSRVHEHRDRAGPPAERRLDHLPSVPATAYLRQAQRVRRRRRAIVGLLVASVVVAHLVIGVGRRGWRVGSSMRGPRRTTRGASEERPPLPRQNDLGPVPTTSPPSLPTRSRRSTVWTASTAITTDSIPSWAQEYGNHGPVAIAPDGRLWVAPDAVVRRTVVDPFDPGRTGPPAHRVVRRGGGVRRARRLFTGRHRVGVPLHRRHRPRGRRDGRTGPVDRRLRAVGDHVTSTLARSTRLRRAARPFVRRRDRR